jgi:hypothetical protein
VSQGTFFSSVPCAFLPHPSSSLLFSTHLLHSTAHHKLQRIVLRSIGLISEVGAFFCQSFNSRIKSSFVGFLIRELPPAFTMTTHEVLVTGNKVAQETRYVLRVYFIKEYANRVLLGVCKYLLKKRTFEHLEKIDVPSSELDYILHNWKRANLGRRIVSDENGNYHLN